jgi:antitoxin (DNA-binding transcriptional repressor) of toxin-antitoxin stability system
MQEEIGIREVRADLAAAVRRAGAGDRIVITIGGRPVATLGPLAPTGGPPTLAELAAAGQLVAPRRHDRPAADLAIDVPVDARLDRVLEELRGR